jgi:hypothetical protein
MKIDVYVINGQACIPLDQVADLIKHTNPLSMIGQSGPGAIVGLSDQQRQIDHTRFAQNSNPQYEPRN